MHQSDFHFKKQRRDREMSVETWKRQQKKSHRQWEKNFLRNWEDEYPTQENDDLAEEN